MKLRVARKICRHPLPGHSTGKIRRAVLFLRVRRKRIEFWQHPARIQLDQLQVLSQEVQKIVIRQRLQRIQEVVDRLLVETV